MAKLNLLAADTDKAYLEALAGYLIDKHSNKFHLSYFTEQECLTNYLNTNEGTADILLVNPYMLPDSQLKEVARIIILLSDGKIDMKFSNFAVVHKYQTGEAIVSALLDIYSEQSTEALALQGENKRTQVIGVYSPQGGSGKTSIALGCAIQCINRDQKIFYLNLESIQSTKGFLEGYSEKNLSHIFYYLKENSATLDVKIESIKQIDAETGIHFFMPPESVLEYEELEPKDFQRLIETLKRRAVYDEIFIDMSSVFDSKNAAILDACDKILVVLAHEAGTGVKANGLLKEVDIVFRRLGTDIREKLYFILNKYNPEAELDIENISWLEEKASLKIPIEPSLVICDEGKCILNLNNKFGEEILKLVRNEMKHE